MVRCGLSLGGYTGAGLAHAYCDESLTRPDRLLVLIATVDHQVVGFLVVLRHPWSFWRGFLARHLVLALKLSVFALGSPPSRADAVPFRWYCQQQIGSRVLLIAVSAECRRRGYGRDLYEALIALSEGSALWALVSADNTASLALHRSTGWAAPDQTGETMLVHHP